MVNVKKILRYLKPYKLFAIIGPLFMILEVMMDLYQPKLMQNIIDIGIANRDFDYVSKTGFLMIIVAAIGVIGGCCCIIFSTTAAINMGTDIRRDLYKKIQKFSGTNIDKFRSGKLITILTNDVTRIQMSVMMMLRIMIRSPLLFIGSIVMVLVTCSQFLPILLVVIPLLLLALILIGKKAGTIFKKVQEALDKVNTTMQENLSGIRVVKAFVREKHEINKFNKVNENLTEVNIKAMQIITILIPVIMLIVNLGIVAALWLGAINVIDGTMDVGQIMAFLNYLLRILISLTMLGMIFVQITRSFPSMDRIIDVLETEIDITDSDKAQNIENISGDVEFKNVSFSYNKNDEMVLKNINFKVKQGEKVGIIGSTGSGKTTLVKLIPRLYDIDKGEIFIGGKDIKQLTLSSLRKAIGMVPQKALLFSGTIENNIRYGKKYANKIEIQKAAEASCAMEFISTFENRFKHQLTQKANNLSGGQKQRLSIARALVRKPSVLIFDDSTSAVDAKSESIIQEKLKQQFKYTTTFIIASKISSIMDSDKILVMDDGSIVGQGTHKELLKQCSVYREIYASQGGKEEKYAE